MLNWKLRWLPLAFCLLSVTAQAQEAKLEPGKPVEREIAGGELHTYQITLQAGQFVRVIVEQKGVDVAVQLMTPEGKPLVEVNFIDGFGQESLSQEVAVAGDYRIVVRTVAATAPRGAYEAKMEVKAAATTQDKQRIEAEGLLAEAFKSYQQGAAAVGTTIEKAEQALVLWRGLADRYWEATTLNLIGNAYSLGGKYDRATEYYNQALQIRRELKDRYGEFNTLNGLGGVYYELNRFEKAIEYYQQSLAIARELKYRFGEASSLHDLGHQHIKIARYEKAIEYLEQALAIRREVKDRLGEAKTLYRLGFAHKWLSRYEKAIEHMEQSLAICRELGDRMWEAAALNGLAGFYGPLGRYERTIEYAQQALAISREMKYQENEAAALQIFGSAYSRLGRYEKAIEYYEQGLVISREIKNRPQEGGLLNNLGLAYASLNRHEKAIEYYEQALAIARAVKNRINEGNILAGLGDSYRALSRLEEAVRAHEQALFIAREVKAKEKEAIALDGLMLDWKARNQPRRAVFYGKQAVNVYQEIRSNIQGLDRELQQSFAKSKEYTYRELADLLIAQGRLPEAEQVINLLKQEEYFDFIRRDSSNAPQANKAQMTPEEAAMEKRYREISDQIAELGTERGTLINKNNRTAEEEQRLAKIDADLVLAGNAFQKFLSQLEAELGASSEASAKAYALRESQGLMEDLRELGKGTVALYTLVGEGKYRVILTAADFQKGYEYPIKAADLNRKVLELREVLQNPRLDPLPLAQELYKILVGPVARDLEKAKAKTLMWSLDGVLRYVPVAALHDGKQYLVERYRNVVFTPASQARLKDAPSNKWDALGLGVTKAHGERIPALPGVAEEMRGIIRDESANNQTGVLPGVVKLDEAFTQEAMLAGLRQRHKVVHIASHFQFQPGNETNSVLLLGDGQFLSLAQIKAMPNVFGGVELLTLSACNTATGGAANGKEVEGFGVLAQRQGAKAVVASLWPVADRSTKLLMQEFYRLRESRQGTAKIEAMRQAQLKLLRGEVAAEPVEQSNRKLVHEEAKPVITNRAPFKADANRLFAHPYYWAPFILIGNWR